MRCLCALLPRPDPVPFLCATLAVLRRLLPHLTVTVSATCWDTTSIFCRSCLTTSSLIHNYKIPSKSHSHFICERSSLSILETSGSDFYAFTLDLIFINAKWSLHEALLSHIKGMMPVSIHLVAKYQETPLIICFVLKMQQREIPPLCGHVP